MKIISSTETSQTNTNMNAQVNTSPTTFLSLPAELRNTIYHLSGCLESHQDWGPVVPLTRAQLSDEDYIIDFDIENACDFCVQRDTDVDPRLSLWVNRNSSFSVITSRARSDKETQDPKDESTSKKSTISDLIKKDREKQSLRHPNIRHKTNFAADAAKHASHIKNGVEQPCLTKVSKQIREDTLPMFYGSNGFLLTLFDRRLDSVSIFKWFRTIGPRNASLLKKVSIVVKSNSNIKYAKTELVPALKKLGLRTDEGAEVRVLKLPYPSCFCEFCTRDLIGEVRHRSIWNG